MWVTKLFIFPVEIRISCPKTTKFGPKFAFLVNFGQAMQAYSMPCCGSVGGCGARAVSRKTPIYFMISCMFEMYIIQKRPLQLETDSSIAAVCLSAKSKSRDAFIRRNKLQLAILKLTSLICRKNTTIDSVYQTHPKLVVHDTQSNFPKVLNIAKGKG